MHVHAPHAEAIGKLLDADLANPMSSVVAIRKEFEG